MTRQTSVIESPVEALTGRKKTVTASLWALAGPTYAPSNVNAKTSVRNDRMQFMKSPPHGSIQHHRSGSLCGFCVFERSGWCPGFTMLVAKLPTPQMLPRKHAQAPREALVSI